MSLKIRVTAWGATALVIALAFLLAIFGYLYPEARGAGILGITIFLIGAIVVLIGYAMRALRLR